MIVQFPSFLCRIDSVWLSNMIDNTHTHTNYHTHLCINFPSILECVCEDLTFALCSDRPFLCVCLCGCVRMCVFTCKVKGNIWVSFASWKTPFLLLLIYFNALLCFPVQASGNPPGAHVPGSTYSRGRESSAHENAHLIMSCSCTMSVMTV